MKRIHTVTMKENIMKHNKKHSNVHSTMIDLPKAFDEMNHYITIYVIYYAA